MTLNQKLAATLAQGIAHWRLDPASLSDWQWQLLLLASGVHCAYARPAVVARRVLESVRARDGYFADRSAPMPPASVEADFASARRMTG
jgi:hypothetical protein